MKKRGLKISLLAGASAVAGLTIGGAIAQAATGPHPAIQLFTYEEIAQQYGMPAGTAMPVMVEKTSKMGMPYSPKQTCMGGSKSNVGCHTPNNNVGLKSYEDMSKGAYHATLGTAEWMDNSHDGLFVDGNGVQTGLNPQKPWLQSHGHNGKW